MYFLRWQIFFGEKCIFAGNIFDMEIKDLEKQVKFLTYALISQELLIIVALILIFLSGK
jgi:hypothetical protein